VLDWRAKEVADFLEMSVPAVNSALQRARATLAKRYHPLGLEAIEAPALTPPLQALLDRYVQAWETNDLEALLALLKEDATFSMPSRPQWYSGRDAIRRFFQTGVFIQESGEWRLASALAHHRRARRENGIGAQRHPRWHRRGRCGATHLTKETAKCETRRLDAALALTLFSSHRSRN
jgi:RNA polymerase sigma-70 factor (ECF subfamily)